MTVYNLLVRLLCNRIAWLKYLHNCQLVVFVESVHRKACLAEPVDNGQRRLITFDRSGGSLHSNMQQGLPMLILHKP